MKPGVCAVSLLLCVLAFQSCADISYNAKVPEVTASIIREIPVGTGFDDLLSEDIITVLGERNTGKLILLYGDMQEERRIEPYTNITIFDGSIYYKSVYDWNYRKLDLNDNSCREIEVKEGNDILLPIGGGGYVLYNDGSGDAVENIGGIERKFSFAEASFGAISIKASDFVFAGYDGKSVRIVNGKGEKEREYKVGEIRDYAVAKGGILVLYRDELIYISDNGKKKLVLKINCDVVSSFGNTAAVYSRTEGILTLIRLF